ncbi:MAG: M1 family aminopeptidase [Acidobacteriota bacterium]
MSSARRLASCLLAFVSFVAVSSAQEIPRLGEDLQPTFQHIHLTVDARETSYSGSVEVMFDVEQATDRVRFHNEGPELTRIAVTTPDGAEVPVVGRDGEGDIVILELEAPLAVGADYRLAIDFTNDFDRHATSLYRAEHEGEAYAFSQMQADDAREAFPVWDEPGFKFPYQMTMRVPKEHMAIFNTPIEATRVEGEWKVVEFARTPPIPSYLLAIATGPLEAIDVPGLEFPSRIVTVQGQKHLGRYAAEVTPPILAYLEDYFGSPYPYAKLDQIAVPEFWPGGMENAGAIKYADRVLLVDAETGSLGERKRMITVIAHELAHMWFGDLVTMEWWDDLWLNEAFATWMATKVERDLFPELGESVAAVSSAQNIMEVDARLTTEPIRRSVRSEEELLRNLGITYEKGSAVVGMFESWLGEETFRDGVRRYMKRHAWGNATADDLWRVLDETSQRPVAEALETFVVQSGLPLVDVVRRGHGRVELRQQRFLNAGVEAEAQTWSIPVVLKHADGAGGAATRSMLLAEPSLVVDLPTGRDGWIFPHAGADGYYRWRLPEGELSVLAANANDLLTPRERIALIGNASALVDAGEMGGDELLAVIEEMLADSDPEVVRIALGELSAVETAFVTPDLEGAWAIYVARALESAKDRFGLEPAAGESEQVTRLRAGLYAWLGGKAEDPDVLQRARQIARAYLADSGSVAPSLVNVALELAARDGDMALFETYLARFEAASEPNERGRFLTSLGYFRDPKVRARALEYSLSGKLRPTEVFQPVFGMTRTVEGRDLLFSWVTENYASIMQRVPPMFASMMPMVSGGCSRERLERGREFFLRPINAVPGTQDALDRVGESVETCVALREREIERVAAYLRRSAGEEVPSNEDEAPLDAAA